MKSQKSIHSTSSGLDIRLSSVEAILSKVEWVKSQKYEKTPRGWPTSWAEGHFVGRRPNGLPRGGGIRKREVGFTLLELLVVISIIVILVTLGLSSFATAQKKSRDAKRKSDIKEVQVALEQYYSVCGYQYITPAGTFFSSINCPTPPISIMPTVPADPRGTTPYYCGPTPGVSNCTSSSYTICAMLESETPNTFCVSNQQ